MSSFVPNPPALSAPPPRIFQPACKRRRPAPPLCVAPPPPRPRTRLPPIPSASDAGSSGLCGEADAQKAGSAAQKAGSAARFEQTCDALRALCEARGALGRGVRATLRAFHRRASFALSTADASPLPRSPVMSACGAEQHRAAHTHSYYVEIGPAYVRATAQTSAHQVSRYAVEFHAWPALQALLLWEEVCTTTARKRRASLRRLAPGARYGRHVFVRADALSALLHVAEELIGDDAADDGREGWCAQDGGGGRTAAAHGCVAEAATPAPLSDSLARLARGLPRRFPAQCAPLRVVALVRLARRPTPGRVAIAAHCPFAETRACCSGRRSLVLWMNDDGLTGGAFCPVCEGRCAAGLQPAATLSESGMVLALAASVAPEASRPALPTPRVTWRVHLLRNNVAALCVPLRGIRRPAHADRLAARVVERRRDAGTGRDDTDAGSSGHANG